MLDVRSAMRRTAAFNRDRIAVKSLGRELTFGESWDRGMRLANALLGMGLAEGDRVAVLEDNCIEAADFYVGSVAANLVRVPLYRRNSSEAHEYMIRHTGAKVVVVSEEFAPELADLTDRIEGLRLLVRDKGYEDWLFSHSSREPVFVDYATVVAYFVEFALAFVGAGYFRRRADRMADQMQD